MSKSNVADRVVVVSFPWVSKTPYKFLSDLVKILDPLTSSIVLIGGNTHRIAISSTKVTVKDINVKMHYVRTLRPRFYSALLWIAKCLLAQLKTSIELVRLRHDVDIAVFYMAYPYHLLSLLTAKLLRMKSVEVITRSKPTKVCWFSKLLALQDTMIFGLLNGISPESYSLVSDLDLQRYQKKIQEYGARFINTEFYSVRRHIKERDYIVGYLGRLQSDKGVREFVEAIPLIFNDNRDVFFLIGGDGELADWVKKKTSKIMACHHGLKIVVTGWIPEEVFPQYLNRLKLLVLPTQHNEGLPTIILESMACGTPVLATPVGGVRDVIKDSETGFVLQNNTPKGIAAGIERVLDYPNLEDISLRARNLIIENYSLEAATERYKRILDMI